MNLTDYIMPKPNGRAGAIPALFRGYVTAAVRECSLRLRAPLLFALLLANVAAQVVSVPESYPATVTAGKEFERGYDSTRVSVRMVTRPYFGSTPSESPTLEVGPASLSFLRDASGGAVVFLGEKPLSLPNPITLAEGGRSDLPLELTLSYDRSSGNAEVRLGSESYTVPASAPAGPLSVVLSAGTKADWPLGTVELDLRPGQSIGAGNGQSASGNPSAGDVPVTKGASTDKHADRLAQNQQAFADALGHARTKDFGGAKEKLAAGSRHQLGTVEWHLETAAKLTHLALTLRQQYDFRGALAAAQEALATLRNGGALTQATVKQRGAVHEMTAFLQDEILRDRDAARVEYEKAQQVDSQSVRARKGLAALDAAEAVSKRQNEGR